MKTFQHSIGLSDASLITWQSILSRMAGNQVVPRLACPAFQEWPPREPTPFFILRRRNDDVLILVASNHGQIF